MNSSITRLLITSSLTAISVFATQSPEQAQPVPPGQTTVKVHSATSPEAQLKHLSRKLALTPDQQNQILPILKNRAAQVAAIQSDTTLTTKEHNSRLFAVRNDAESRLRNVLTDNQRTAYDQMVQEQRERAKTKRLTTVSN